MTDKEKLIKIKSLADKMYDAAFNLTTDASLLRKAMDDYHQFIINEYHKEEPVSDECIYNRTLEEKQKSCKFCSAACQVRIKEEPVSEDLEDFAKRQADVFAEREYEVTYDKAYLFKGYYWGCKAGAEWQKKHLWKPADGDDLPEIDREVVALLDNGKVVFAHRPPEYWDGKDIVTGKVTRNYPKTYDKGGWNIPNVKYWLDCLLPNMED